jgi:hypothetical protein
VKTPLDKIGQPIVVGSYIAYGHALGRSAGIRIGRVLVIKHSTEPLFKDGSGRIKDVWRITVIGLDDDWSWCHREPKLCERKGTLQFPERMIVLAPELVPAKFRVLLDGYEA